MLELYPYARALGAYSPRGHKAVRTPRHINAIATMAEEYLDRYHIPDDTREGARFIFWAVSPATPTFESIQALELEMTQVTVVRMEESWALGSIDLVMLPRRHANRGQLVLTDAQNLHLLRWIGGDRGH